MSAAIIVRQFRGQPLFLVAGPGQGKSFVWSANQARAMKVESAVLAPTLAAANEYQSEAYAIDAIGNVIVPAAAAAVAQPIAEVGQFQLENHGSLFLVRPLNDAAREWLQRTAPEDAQFMGEAMAVEPRYVQGVTDAIEADGGVVS